MSLTVDEISDDTWLSPREAEIFDFRMRKDLGREDTADALGIKASTVQTVENRIKNKREKSERTLELFEDIEEDDS